MQETDILSIPPYLRQYFAENPQFHYYEAYKKHVSPQRQIDDCFLCLKGFSSSTPLVNSVAFRSASMGGGFYFRINGRGIVVDPGIGFTTLMHNNNIFIDDIDVVIVTHAHIDHNCDVSALSSLLYDFNRNREKQTKIYSTYLNCSKVAPHIIDWYLDDTTYDANQTNLDPKHLHYLSELLDEPRCLFAPECDSLSVVAMRTHHISDSNDSFCLKFMFKLPDRTAIWGYTSDTAYFEQLDTFFSGCDALLLNISDVYVDDIVHSKSKRHHLGFTGCKNLISSIKPKVALISEFCCTNGDYRIEIVRLLREQPPHSDTLILPAEVGCKISIAVQNMECSLCRRHDRVGSMKAVRPQREYEKIQYICADCLL